MEQEQLYSLNQTDQQYTKYSGQFRQYIFGHFPPEEVDHPAVLDAAGLGLEAERVVVRLVLSIKRLVDLGRAEQSIANSDENHRIEITFVLAELLANRLQRVALEDKDESLRLRLGRKNLLARINLRILVFYESARAKRSYEVEFGGEQRWIITGRSKVDIEAAVIVPVLVQVFDERLSWV